VAKNRLNKSKKRSLNAFRCRYKSASKKERKNQHVFRHRVLAQTIHANTHHSKKTSERHATQRLTEANGRNNPKNIFS
jgi:hypothetical protein